MKNSSGLKYIFGGGVYGNPGASAELSTDEGMLQSFKVLKSHGVTDIDSAQLYPGSEAALGRNKAVSEHGFDVSTKWMCGASGEPWATSEKMVETARESLKLLDVDQVDIFYMHIPDLKVPFGETLKGVNEAYKMGAFRRFGLSNFSPRQTQEVLEICKKNGYVLPKVYQGNYSAAARLAEDKLLPLLRENGISFYAYSPVAGGFLTKTRQFVENREGRFNAQVAWGIYALMYGKPSYLDFIDEWNKIAEDEGISKTELALRWMNHHSALRPEHGDGIIFGTSSLNQLERTCKFLEAGPLPNEVTKRIDDLWNMVKDDAILDNFQAREGRKME